jgi:hypothetical protein
MGAYILERVTQMYKTLLFAAISVFLISMNLYAGIGGKPQAPSPYTVYDNDMIFWNMYSIMSSPPGISKFGENFLVSDYGIDLAAYIEMPLSAKHRFFDPIDLSTEDGPVFSFFFSGGGQIKGNGNPDISIWSSKMNSYRSNEGRSGAFGAGFYSTIITAKAGANFKWYYQPFYVYENGSEVVDPGYFNNKFPGPGKYRMIVQPFAEISIPEWRIIPKLLHVSNADKLSRSSFTRVSTEIPLLDRKYTVTPYFIYTKDLDGFHSFGAKQAGAQQIIVIDETKETKNSRLNNYITCDINYTTMNRTVLAPGKNVLFAKADFYYRFVSFSSWYNTETKNPGFGMTLFAFFRTERTSMPFGIEIGFKYNPYLTAPLYVRNTVKNGIAGEFNICFSF